MWKPQTGGIELPSGVYIHIYIHTYIHARSRRAPSAVAAHQDSDLQDRICLAEWPRRPRQVLSCRMAPASKTGSVLENGPGVQDRICLAEWPRRPRHTGGMELPSGVYIHIYIHTYIHARPVEGHPGLCTHIPGRMQDIRVYIHTCIQVAYPADWRHPGHRSRSRSQSRSKSRATHQVQERSAAGRGGSLINSSGAGEVGGWERR